ncbi:MAG: DUF2271 domain-containing protein [Treponema sp.]|nr:DUF2271 domain-containing protein [Treponema sp.]
MKNLLIISILSILVISCTAKAQSVPQETQGQSGEQAAMQSAQPTAEITFTFTRQSGSASNQYAVWIEDVQGQYIKTLYATQWTARGGYSRRPTSIPLWVERSNLANKSSAQVDAVSGATPRTGTVTYTWDGTDSNGVVVPIEEYILILEATLRWENQVYVRAPLYLGYAAPAKMIVEYISGDRDTRAERAMISDIRVYVLR